MKKIEIDDEVYAYLQSRAYAFVETPNKTLRRLFEIDKKKLSKAYKPSISKGRKKRKTNLSELVNAGLLNDNQIVYLRDYQEKEIPGYQAKIFHGYLLWNEQSYSMSELAKILLKKQGYASDSVRGPAHWFTKDGISIKDIWNSYLEDNQK